MNLISKEYFEQYQGTFDQELVNISGVLDHEVVAHDIIFDHEETCGRYSTLTQEGSIYQDHKVHHGYATLISPEPGRQKKGNAMDLYLKDAEKLVKNQDLVKRAAVKTWLNRMTGKDAKEKD